MEGQERKRKEIEETIAMLETATERSRKRRIARGSIGGGEAVWIALVLATLIEVGRHIANAHLGATDGSLCAGQTLEPLYLSLNPPEITVSCSTPGTTYSIPLPGFLAYSRSWVGRIAGAVLLLPLLRGLCTRSRRLLASVSVANRVSVVGPKSCIKCPFCGGLYVRPTLLPCLVHALCQPCASRHGVGSGNVSVCPLPGCGVEGKAEENFAPLVAHVAEYSTQRAREEAAVSVEDRALAQDVGVFVEAVPSPLVVSFSPSVHVTLRVVLWPLLVCLGYPLVAAVLVAGWISWRDWLMAYV